jgi:hypothetical protein
VTAIAAAEPGRPALLRRALRLEYLTVGWNVVEDLVAIGLAAGSAALIGFGIEDRALWPSSWE